MMKIVRSLFPLFVMASIAPMEACGPADGDATSAGGALSDSDEGVPPAWNRAVSRPANESAASQLRSTCAFKRGAMPAETLGAEIPVDHAIPIETIVVIMQENRSFDSYFGHLNQYAHRTDIESSPDDASNPEQVNVPDSPRRPYQHAKMLCMPDTNHEWAGSHLEYNGGQMDGFFQANDNWGESDRPAVAAAAKNGERALWWYDERDIPFYYDLAATFGIGDHYHSSLLGPTTPNRDFLYAATSRGVTTSRFPDLDGLGPEKNILLFDELSRRGITWTVYVDGFPHIPRVGAFVGAGFGSRWGTGEQYVTHFASNSVFNSDAANGKLPQVVFIDGNIIEDVHGEDEHPPSDIQTGQKFVSDTIHTLFASPQWKSLAIFFTYDEHGGIYDHVAPPPACAPDDIAPVLENTEDRAYPGAFDRLGVRVPFVVVSPYAKRSFVSHKTYDHTSITRFIETKFKLPALTNRDANADPLFDFFDFDHPPFMTPPQIAAPTIDAARYQDCVDLFDPPPDPVMNP
jgi:phospholipase C